MREDEIERTETAELSDYIRVIRERAWVIVLAVVIVAAVAVAVSLMQTPQYRASASLVYQKNNLDQALFGSQVFSNPNQDREVQTGADLVQTEFPAGLDQRGAYRFAVFPRPEQLPSRLADHAVP